MQLQEAQFVLKRRQKLQNLQQLDEQIKQLRQQVSARNSFCLKFDFVVVNICPLPFSLAQFSGRPTASQMWTDFSRSACALVRLFLGSPDCYVRRSTEANLAVIRGQKVLRATTPS